MFTPEMNDKFQAIITKYRKRMYKKEEGKPRTDYILMERTFRSAASILALINGIELQKLFFDTHYICVDVQFTRFIRLYDSQIELAGIDPEKFVFGLHKFYLGIAKKIKAENKAYEFAQFIGAIMQIQHEKKKRADENIVDAYISLIMQTLEYLRKNRFNLDTYPYGVSTQGEILEGPCPLAYSDLPSLEVERIIYNYAQITKKMDNPKPLDTNALLKSAHEKYGYSITCQNDLDCFEQTQRIHCNTTMAMFPFINEYTFDITSTTALDAARIPFLYMTVNGTPVEEWKRKLRKRSRTLPSNGVYFEIIDSTGELHGMLMKELVYNGSVHMVYRLDIFGSSMSGYFDTTSGFFYSVLREAFDLGPYNRLEAFVLALYASQVLNDVKLVEISKQFLQGGHSLDIKAFGRSGKIKDIYHKMNAKKASHRDMNHYDKEDRQINVIIRTLPDGHKASNEAKALAEQYGYELAPNQTFVRPFIKQVFVRKTE